MLISKVSEEGGAAGAEPEPTPGYRTASELFELMAKNVHFDSHDDDSLTARDLVLLYKNIDVGTKLMSDATGLPPRKSNQYVETIVYNDDLDSESDASEIYSSDDIHNVFMANQERLDFLNDRSLENLLCHKFGALKINSSNLPADYDKNILFKDPYIKNQLTNGVLNPCEFDGLFSTSLIDYICCKRLEDNYNFYMDNIIKYVQHTIEQLKRISNGDYLTDKTKEKWREVDSTDQKQKNDTKVLATSTSIPLHVECKQAGVASWDDIVHSEVDIRSLSKILEKKIVVEIPKLICGSYHLYSRQCSDNLIISCQRERREVEPTNKGSRVDVVLQLQRSQSGQVISNISSIMVLRTSPALSDVRANKILSLPYKEKKDVGNDLKDSNFTVVELKKNIYENTDVRVTELEEENSNNFDIMPKHEPEYYVESQNDGSCFETNDYPFSDRNNSCDFVSNQQSSESSLALRDTLDKSFFPVHGNELTYNKITTDELRLTMHRLHKTASVLEESGEDLNTPKKRSPVRVRIKSPYENKSFLMEEKKRKRLLEIRERREKKKLALSENRKISKHKYGKGSITPQASSSVTKLSITNKAFYNSIYGQTANEEKPKARQSQRSSTSDLTPKDEAEALALTKKNNKKYVNRSYYLDDTETEMMYQSKLDNESKDNQALCSASNSFVSNESHEEFDLLKQLIEPPASNRNNDQTYTINTVCKPSNNVSFSREDSLVELTVSDITAPANSDNEAHFSPKKGPSTGYECRKSIDKLYDLIKKFKKPKSPDTARSMMPTNASSGVRGDVIIQGSESGTSVKHNITASNHSCCSGEKCNNNKTKTNKNQVVTITPKVVISSKIPSTKTEPEKTKKDRKFVFSPQYKGPPADNPLKAISQLLHEFDNVQKTRHKQSPDARAPKKAEIPNIDIKNKATQQGSYRRRSRLEQHLKDFEQVKKTPPTYQTSVALKDKMRAKPVTPAELARAQPVHAGDKGGDKVAKKKIADIIDEAKEARGEAVRGPSKFSSRLNSLAQPKKSYVMAHHEQYQHRYGRTVVGERLQRLAEAPAERTAERPSTSPSSRNRWKRNASEVATVASAKLSSPPALHLDKGERGVRRTLRSTSSSPASTARHPASGILPAHGALHHAQEPMGNKKVMALESYVQGRSGRAQPAGAALLAGLRSRIPLVPRDIELESSPSSPCVASVELGATLRQLVGAAVGNTALGSLAECAESGGRVVSDSEDFAPPEDNLSTAVQAVRSGSELRDPLDALELEMLESALYSHISGAFQKRLRIKNLTLTPKHSMQRIFYLQSGDGGPSAGGSLHDLKAVPVLSGSDIDWGFAHFPKQIATVGYMFPEYRDAATRGLAAPRHHEFSSQCFKGSPGEACADCAAQVDVTAEVVAVTVEDNGNQVTRSQMLIEVERMQGDANRTNSVQNFLKIEYVNNEEDASVKPAVVVQDEEEDEVVLEVVMEDEEAEVAAVEPVMVEDLNYVKKDDAASNAPSVSPDYTTSLDMLVGLLNEIQKITCQEAVKEEVKEVVAAGFVKQDKTASRDLISLASLDNMRQLESSTSIYSFSLSSGTGVSDRRLRSAVNTVAERVDESTDTQQFSVDRLTIDEIVMTALGDLTRVDKQISAGILCHNYVDICTEVPSGLLPVAVDRSANASSCALLPADSASALSVYSLADCQMLYPDALLPPNLKANIESPQIEVKHCVPIPRHLNKLRVKNEKSLVRSELRKYCVKNIDLDPMLRVKRDILVTMYSILVFTVFAALSFPELLKFQS